MVGYEPGNRFPAVEEFTGALILDLSSRMMSNKLFVRYVVCGIWGTEDQTD